MSGRIYPGPWSVELDMIRNGDIDVVADGLTGIAHVDCRRSPDEQRVPRETALANARLIAAAPDYHAAALSLLKEHDATAQSLNFNRCGCRECLMFRPIVAKAEGREQ